MGTDLGTTGPANGPDRDRRRGRVDQRDRRTDSLADAVKRRVASGEITIDAYEGLRGTVSGPQRYRPPTARAVLSERLPSASGGA